MRVPCDRGATPPTSDRLARSKPQWYNPLGAGDALPKSGPSGWKTRRAGRRLERQRCRFHLGTPRLVLFLYAGVSRWQQPGAEWAGIGTSRSTPQQAYGNLRAISLPCSATRHVSPWWQGGARLRRSTPADVGNTLSYPPESDRLLRALREIQPGGLLS